MTRSRPAPRFFVAALVLAIAWLSMRPLSAQTVDIQGPPTRALLVELFTSEGCSSCPPAEKWLNALKDRDDLWQRVVPIALHVDYWDYIGWPDRFATSKNSLRQRTYRKDGLSRGVYTPGLFVGGREWRGWFRNRELDLAEAGKRIGSIRIKARDGHFEASFEALSPAVIQAPALDLHIARIGFDLETSILAGENRGRTLHHDFVSLGRSVHRLVRTDDAGDIFWRARGALPEAIVSAEREGIVAWVSPAGELPPIQAAGGLFDIEGNKEIADRGDALDSPTPRLRTFPGL
ncbi:DUF1223 domain-containing protein [Thioalkalivibrio sp. HK1]|uniref:DUF1223 domain-containing protein n=1 Tax=Thioalkalivibrio sp. HK1 TaxID=1469245 RepID=UPI00046FC6DA|nr:DUF1223 domain-containing protein [Thioalkalivibrio sp. HK1]